MAAAAAASRFGASSTTATPSTTTMPSTTMRRGKGRLIANSTHVSVRLASDRVSELERHLLALGANNVELDKFVVSAWLTPAQVSAIDAELVNRADVEVARQSAVTSEGVRSHFADLARDVKCNGQRVTGKGIKVGILSDTFNCFGGYKKGVKNGELPNVRVLLEGDCFAEVGDEGRAMAGA